MTGLRPVRCGLAPALAGLALAGCAVLPDSGPVQEGVEPRASASAQPFEYNPPGPRPGASPTEIVAGFLSAQQAIPVSSRVAAQYLTEEAAERWRPDRATLIYAAQRLSADGASVRVRLTDASTLDATGRWRGSWSGDGVGSTRLDVVREGGSWRIANPPDALVIPRSHFESRYLARSLYFFDPTGSVLVPEKVYLPTGAQAATRLVAGLVAGPPRATRVVERSYLPPAADAAAAVPVRQGGVAEVSMPPEVLDLGARDLSRMVAQLAWTLRQLPEVTALRLVVDGEPVGLPDGQSVVPVTGFGEYDPTVAWATADLFGLRGRGIVRISGETESLVLTFPRPRVAAHGAPRSLGVSLRGDRAAVVSGDGTVAWTADIGSAALGTDRPIRGTDLLRPMWDRTDRLWVLDRTVQGPRLRVVEEQGRRRLPLPPALDGREVVAASLSRDGTRLALLQGGPAAEVLVLRVVRDSAGGPVRLTAPTVITGDTPARRALGLGWRDEVTVAVMSRPSAAATRIHELPADGAALATPGSLRLDLLFEKGRSVSVSPAPPHRLVLSTAGGSLYELQGDGRWAARPEADGILGPVFVG